MRFIFLIPELDTSRFRKVVARLTQKARLQFFKDLERKRFMRTDFAFGGTLNLMRHCKIARDCGADAYMATIRGIDTYGKAGIPGIPFMRWADRQPDDVCIVPDFVSDLIDEVEGRAIAYLQVPTFTLNNFDYQADRVALWTDSPFMQEICERTYPGKAIEIVPNIVDNQLFPFVPQSQREPGLVFAFPRKGPEYIAQTQAAYQRLGGNYWRFELIDGLTIRELAHEFRRPQVFLASADVEGCALPPQESMASGVVVVGKTARGANFCMEHRQTAMVAETPEAAAQCLLELEQAELRDRISRQAYQAIRYFFPSEEPTRFWQRCIQQYERSTRPSKVYATSR
ncbi:glycosyltransferase family 1 protein [Pantanalinema rosaneae CENA516]|uniref:glycosyltransferase n=1 Tax=Pantanalinema rosaneae TaxID=1620701 RepID=UPI003D6E0599